MPDPLTQLIVAQVFEDTDSAIVETFNVPGSLVYHLGSGLTPVYPGSAPLIPKGAGFYGPTLFAAPTAGDPITDGGLVSNGNYKWAMTVVTQWGESLPSSLLSMLLGSGNTGMTIVLPSVTERVDNPIIYRRLYRTTHGGTQLELVVEIEDANVSEYVDAIPDEDLETVAPVADTTGSFGSVDIYDGSTHWAEVSLGTTLADKQFAVDYTVMDSGGTLNFFNGNIGVPVTVTYYAGTFLGSAFLNQYKTGLRKVYDMFRTDTTTEFSHNLIVDGTLEVKGLETIDVTGGLHILGGPPDFQVANIFGSGSNVVTIGHTSNHQDLGVTGIANLTTVHVADPNVLHTNYIDGETGAFLLTVNHGLTVTGRITANDWINTKKILSSGAAPLSVVAVAPTSPICAFFGSNNTDFAGIVHFKPDAGTVAGDQFELTYSTNTVHSANPIVILTCKMGGGSIHPIAWMTSLSDASAFIATTKDVPTNGEDYYIGYVVIN